MDLLHNYLQAAKQQFETGNAREHSYRPALSELLTAIAPEDAIVTNEPARVKCGSPDFIIAKKEGNIPLGYVEAKDIGVNLGKTEGSEQLLRYLEGLNKLVLTDYLEFRFYVKGEFRNTHRIGEVKNGSIEAMPEQFDSFVRYFKNFLSISVPMIVSADTLAEQMAAKARLIRNSIEKAINEDLSNNNSDSELVGQFRAFESFLIEDIKPQQFADLYAQTIAYGMFAARFQAPEQLTFTRQDAAKLLPASNPFLRKLFQSIAGFDAEAGIDWVIDELTEVFQATDVKAVTQNLSHLQSGREDPTIHFYESFLQHYDPQIREMRGVYYTPQPVVEFMVRAVDELLKTEFNLPKGLADTSKIRITVQDENSKNGATKEIDVHRVQILDPATGTGTFLNQIIRFLYETYFAKMAGMWNSYVEHDLLPRLNGFELMMAPYAMAHLKLDLLLNETGYHHKGNERFRIFLTNSLGDWRELSGNIFAAWLAKEADEANKIKRDVPVMVVMGNPPYSGESANKGEWIGQLMEDYKKEPDGSGKLKEKNSKWINDDYVKFIRYAEHLIDKTGEGILAYITNHSYLDNPTFRGMRFRLLQSFDEIWIIDLHGNAKKKEKAPDGSADKNVFDIQQGVAVIIAIKKKASKGAASTLHHLDLWGDRESKFRQLQETPKPFQLPFQTLQPQAPHYFFVPKNFDHAEEYNKGISVNQLYVNYGVGITTAHDEYVIHFDRNTLFERFRKFKKERGDANALHHTFSVNKKAGWDILKGWRQFQSLSDAEIYEKIMPIEYRPFDSRYIIYDDDLLWRSVQKLMQHFIRGQNIGLCFGKRIEQDRDFADVFVFDSMVQHHSLSLKEVNYVAPLYLFVESPENGTSADSIPYQKKVNVSYANIRRFEQLTQRRYDGAPSIDEPQKGMNGHKYTNADTFSPEDILDYVYAVLHQPRYRERFAEFLKIDFPRVPWPEADSFPDYVRIGGELRQLHLITHPNIDAHDISYPIDGNSTVDKPKWIDNCVFINKDQYFAGIEEDTWNFHVGGYQPLQKWLKDRKGRALTFDELTHYMRIAAALAATRELMAELDEL